MNGTNMEEKIAWDLYIAQLAYKLSDALEAVGFPTEDFNKSLFRLKTFDALIEFLEWFDSLPELPDKETVWEQIEICRKHFTDERET